MRTIKFRAKVFDEPNEWVIGYLVKKGNHYCILQEYEHEGSKSCGCGVFGIDEETLGEFTGLQDKNRKDIYEGDVLKYESESGKHKQLYEIKILNGGVRDREIHDDAFRLIKDSEHGLDLSVLEIAGNIYDNPELLKEV